MGSALSRRLGVGIVVLAAGFWALHALHDALATLDWASTWRELRTLPVSTLAAASALTALTYLILTCYDFFGLQYAGTPLPLGRTVFASFVAYVTSNNLGLSMLGGMALRYRLYRSWQLPGASLVRVGLFCAATFWLGLLTLGGAIFAFWPPAAAAQLYGVGGAVRPLGCGLLALALAYLLASWRWRRPLRVFRWTFALPSPRLALLQIALSVTDWLLACGVLYTLLSAGAAVPFSRFLGIYMLASLAGLISHVPGGLGVIESVMLLALGKEVPAPTIVATLLAYRVVFFLLPLALGMSLWGGYELRRLARGAESGPPPARERRLKLVASRERQTSAPPRPEAPHRARGPHRPLPVAPVLRLATPRPKT